MDNLSRLTFLGRHSNDLQGLRWVPLLTWLLWDETFLALPEQLSGKLAALASSIVLVGAYFGLARYYDRHFGHLKQGPEVARDRTASWLLLVSAFQDVADRTQTWLVLLARLVLLIMILEWLYTLWISSSHTFRYYFVYLIVFVMIRRVLDKTNPVLRRTYYGLASAIIVAIGSLTLAQHWGMKAFNITTYATLLAVCIADHFVLLSLTATLTEEADA